MKSVGQLICGAGGAISRPRNGRFDVLNRSPCGYRCAMVGISEATGPLPELRHVFFHVCRDGARALAVSGRSMANCWRRLSLMQPAMASGLIPVGDCLRAVLTNRWSSCSVILSGLKYERLAAAPSRAPVNKLTRTSPVPLPCGWAPVPSGASGTGMARRMRSISSFSRKRAAVRQLAIVVGPHFGRQGIGDPVDEIRFGSMFWVDLSVTAGAAPSLCRTRRTSAGGSSGPA